MSGIAYLLGPRVRFETLALRPDPLVRSLALVSGEWLLTKPQMT
jgi:hypothetical protein